MAYWNLKINKAEVINTYKVNTCYGGQEDYMDVMIEGTICNTTFKFLVSDTTWSFSRYDTMEERFKDNISYMLRDIEVEDFLEICQKSLEDSYVMRKVDVCHGKYGK